MPFHHVHDWKVVTSVQNPDGSITYFLRCSCGAQSQRKG